MLDHFQTLMLSLIDAGWWPPLWSVIWILIKIFAIVLPLLGAVAYTTLWERKLIGWMHIRLGPNRVGPLGLLQPIADAVKLIFKEMHVADPGRQGPVLLGAGGGHDAGAGGLGGDPVRTRVVLADVNAGLLYVMAITSLGVYGVIIAGWASNSKYAFLGALRASAQMVSYELAMGFVLVVVLLVTGSMNMSAIVKRRTAAFSPSHGWTFLSWNWLPLLPLFGIYVISATAETNRHPFDVVEGESEIVAGHMIEYSGMAIRDVLPGRIRQHDPALDHGGGHVPRRLGGAGGPGRMLACTRRLVARRLSNWFWLFAKTLSSCRCTSGSVPRFRATATTRSCGWAGRSSFRSRWSGWS